MVELGPRLIKYGDYGDLKTSYLIKQQLTEHFPALNDIILPNLLLQNKGGVLRKEKRDNKTWKRHNFLINTTINQFENRSARSPSVLIEFFTLCCIVLKPWICSHKFGGRTAGNYDSHTPNRSDLPYWPSLQKNCQSNEEDIEFSLLEQND